MLTICIDVDNVLNNLTERLLEIYNNRTNKQITMDLLTDYNFYECINKEDADCLTALFKDEELWLSLKPIVGAKKIIQYLIDKGHKVLFASATCPESVLWKCNWLSDRFPFIGTDNFIRIIDKSLIKCDVLIEDNMEQLIKSSADRICFDYPWNQQSEFRDEVYGIHRCHNWDDIMNEINKIWKELKRYE